MYDFFLSFPIYRACVSCHSRIQLPFPHLIILGGCFVNFDGIARLIYFYLSQHTMFTISALITKTRGICEGASKQFPDPKNFTALHGSEIPGSATVFVKYLYQKKISDVQVHDDF